MTNELHMPAIPVEVGDVCISNNEYAGHAIQIIAERLIDDHEICVYLAVVVDQIEIEIYSDETPDAICEWGWDAAHFNETNDEFTAEAIAGLVDAHLRTACSKHLH